MQTSLVKGDVVSDGWLPATPPTARLTLDRSRGEKIVAAFGSYSDAIQSLGFNTSFGRTLLARSPFLGTAEGLALAASEGKSLPASGAGAGSAETLGARAAEAQFELKGSITGFRLRGSGDPPCVSHITFLTDGVSGIPSNNLGTLDSETLGSYKWQRQQALPPANQPRALTQLYGTPGGPDAVWDDGATWDGETCSLDYWVP